MTVRSEILILVFVALATTVSSCSVTAVAAPSPISLPAPTVTPSPAVLDTPEAVVRAFYTWYLEYSRGPERRNPLVDGAYRDTDYLTPELVETIADTLASFTGGAYDPILCAQDVPEDVTVGPATVNGRAARLTVHTSFVGHAFEVQLQQRTAGWQMSAIVCAPVGAEDSPEAVVERFYAWYLEYLGRPDAPEMRNPLVDRAYRDSKYLTPAFVAEVDALVDGFDRGGYDPFLCAQDVPWRVDVASGRTTPTGVEVVVDTLWTGNPLASHITVALAPGETGWLINAIHCNQPLPSPLTAEQTVLSFYDLYLGAIGRTQPPRNLLADGGYRSLPFLSAAFVGRVEAFLSAPDGAGYDPFLCAQDVPATLSATETTSQAGMATVVVSSGSRDHHFTVRLDQYDGFWQIADIVCSDPTRTPENVTDWSTYVNTEFGFQVAYPPTWTYQELTADPDAPPIGPPNMQLIVLLMPQAWADQMQRSGPPDPSAPPITPYAIEVTVGSLEEYRQTNPEPTDRHEIIIQGHTVLEEEEEEVLVAAEDSDDGRGLRLVRYLFTHPDRDDVRVTLVDPITGFPSRVEASPEVAAVLPAILATFEFTR